MTLKLIKTEFTAEEFFNNVKEKLLEITKNTEIADLIILYRDKDGVGGWANQDLTISSNFEIIGLLEMVKCSFIQDTYCSEEID